MTIIGEGEETIVELLEAINTKRNLAHVRGIAFRDADKLGVNGTESIDKRHDSLLPYCL